MCFCYFKIKVSRSNLVKKGETCPGLPYQVVPSCFIMNITHFTCFFINTLYLEFYEVNNFK